MSFTPFVDTCKVIVEMSQYSYQITNTLWFEKSDFTEDDQDDLVLEVWSQWAAEIMPLLTDDTILIKVTCYDMSSETARVVVHEGTPVPGTSALDPIPVNTAFVATLRTENRGRSSRGRLFLSGFSEGSVDAGIFATSVVTNILAALDEIQEALNTIGWVLCVASQWIDGVKRTVGLMQPVTSIVSRSPIPGTMGRRANRP